MYILPLVLLLYKSVPDIVCNILSPHSFYHSQTAFLEFQHPNLRQKLRIHMELYSPKRSSL